ncbi:proline-rich protein 36 [Monodelphis domestica]|uniref:proline-rich protein 36 n=1 Tax=Monodelphis domestica TaxID=13616 RepID=UPI0024E25131|nr:proline-rich protein 36 [Monodelphis domestica]
MYERVPLRNVPGPGAACPLPRGGPLRFHQRREMSFASGRPLEGAGGVRPREGGELGRHRTSLQGCSCSSPKERSWNGICMRAKGSSEPRRPAPGRQPWQVLLAAGSGLGPPDSALRDAGGSFGLALWAVGSLPVLSLCLPQAVSSEFTGPFTGAEVTQVIGDACRTPTTITWSPPPHPPPLGSTRPSLAAESWGPALLTVVRPLQLLPSGLRVLPPLRLLSGFCPPYGSSPGSAPPRGSSPGSAPLAAPLRVLPPSRLLSGFCPPEAPLRVLPPSRLLSGFCSPGSSSPGSAPLVAPLRVLLPWKLLSGFCPPRGSSLGSAPLEASLRVLPPSRLLSGFCPPLRLLPGFCPPRFQDTPKARLAQPRLGAAFQRPAPQAAPHPRLPATLFFSSFGHPVS